MRPERRFKPGMDGGLPAAPLISSPPLYLRTAVFLSRRAGPPHTSALPALHTCPELRAIPLEPLPPVSVPSCGLAFLALAMRYWSQPCESRRSHTERRQAPRPPGQFSYGGVYVDGHLSHPTTQMLCNGSTDGCWYSAVRPSAPAGKGIARLQNGQTGTPCLIRCQEEATSPCECVREVTNYSPKWRNPPSAFWVSSKYRRRFVRQVYPGRL